MRLEARFVWAAIAAAVVTHIAVVYSVPRVFMAGAIAKLGEGGFNRWTISPRVTPFSRSIVRPAPDFAYSACAYDLAQGPLFIRVAPSESYWSLSLYGANSDNFFVIDDREARYGAEIALVRKGSPHPEGAATVVESSSGRGIALIRRLAPSANEYEQASAIARDDVCASVAGLTRTE